MHRLALVARVSRGLAACADEGPSPGRAGRGRRLEGPDRRRPRLDGERMIERAAARPRGDRALAIVRHPALEVDDVSTAP